MEHNALLLDTKGFAYNANIKRIKNLAKPVGQHDAVRLDYMNERLTDEFDTLRKSTLSLSERGTFDAKSLAIENLRNPMSKQDAVTKRYVDNQLEHKAITVSKNDDQIADAKSRIIRNVGPPFNPTDATPKAYVDSLLEGKISMMSKIYRGQLQTATNDILLTNSNEMQKMKLTNNHLKEEIASFEMNREKDLQKIDNIEKAITMINQSIETLIDSKICDFDKYEKYLHELNKKFNDVDYEVKTATINNNKLEQLINKITDKLDIIEHEVGDPLTRKMENLKQTFINKLDDYQLLSDRIHKLERNLLERKDDSTFDHSQFETTTELNERFEQFRDAIQSRVVELLKEYSEHIKGINEKIDKLKDNIYDKIQEIHRTVEQKEAVQVLEKGDTQLIEKQVKEEVKAGEAAINEKLEILDKYFKDKLGEVYTNLIRIEDQQKYSTAYTYDNINDRIRNLEEQQKQIKTKLAEKY